MNQSKAFLVSFAAAAVAMLLVFFYINIEKKKIKDLYGTEVVVTVAKVKINELQEIKAEMLTTKVLPKNFVQPGSHGDPRAFEGMVAIAGIEVGEQVLLTKVYAKGAETGIASQIAIHHRAISVPVNDVTGITKLLKPGDRIDLVANVAYQGEGGNLSEVKTMLQNVHVLAVGEQIQNNIPAVFEEDPVTGQRFAKNIRGLRNYGTVTIEVNPSDAQKIIYVIETGAPIYLTLRNPVDRLVASIPTLTVDEVLGENSRKAALEAAKNRLPAALPQRKAATPPPPPPPAFQKGGLPIAN